VTTATRPDIKPSRTSIEYALEVASLLAVFAAVSIIATAWGSLPDRVPSHFGAAGNPDAFGAKGSVLAPAVLTVGLYLLFSVVQLIPPRLYNYPVHISADNALAQYSLVRTCLAAIKAGICTFLAFGTWLTIQVALGQRQGLGSWFIPGVLLATILPMVWYGTATYRQRKA
jgi:uncharacterized membrane protein